MFADTMRKSRLCFIFFGVVVDVGWTAKRGEDKDVRRHAQKVLVLLRDRGCTFSKVLSK
jgi:hypothetical protein